MTITLTPTAEQVAAASPVGARRHLGYRSLFTTRSGADLLPATQSRLYQWFADTKGWDPGALQVGRWATIADGVRALVLRHEDGTGGESVRVRIVESKPEGCWVVQVTVHVPAPGGRDSWAWVDIEAPNDDLQFGQRRKWIGTPRFVGPLVDAVDAWDGSAQLGTEPRVIRGDRADEVYNALIDPTRRGVVFVAGSATLPMIAWSQAVGQLTRFCVGLAAVYVLDESATERLNHRLGVSHAVRPGMLRTYRTHVRPGLHVDGLRHRRDSADRLRDTADRQRLARILGLAAREQATKQPLPPEVRRVHQQLERLTTDLIVRRLGDSGTKIAFPAPRLIHPGAVPAPPATGLRPDVAPQPAAEPDTDVAAPTTATPTVAVDQTASSSVAEAPPVPDSDAGGKPGAAAMYAQLLSVVRESFGLADVTRSGLAEMARLARVGLQAEQAHADVTDRFTEVQSELEQEQQRATELVRRLEDEQLEAREALDDAREARQTIRRLRAALRDAGRYDEAWVVAEDSDLERPADFAELLQWLPQRLDRVRFTGDADHALALDERDPVGTFAGKAWDALLALQDYAAAKTDGRWDRDVTGYLQNTPDGCHTWSANKHAFEESSEVRNNAVWARARMLPVPTSVDPSGVAWHGAHFKLAKSGMISPRLHYVDDTANSGFVYVGYIGRHLPNGQTN
jgi:hypothetical protein